MCCPQKRGTEKAVAEKKKTSNRRQKGKSRGSRSDRHAGLDRKTFWKEKSWNIERFARVGGKRKRDGVRTTVASNGKKKKEDLGKKKKVRPAGRWKKSRRCQSFSPAGKKRPGGCH